MSQSQPTAGFSLATAAPVAGALLFAVAVAGFLIVSKIGRQHEPVSYQPAPVAAGERGGSMRLVVPGEWGPSPIYRPVVSGAGFARDLVLERIIQVDETGDKPVFTLAVVEVDNEGKTGTIRLRRGLRFHAHPCVPGGREADQGDLAFSIQLAQERLGVGVSSVAVEEDRVRVSLEGPSPYAGLSRVWLVPRELAGCELADLDDLRQLVGTGPFAFSGPVAGDEITLVRHDGYWGVGPDGQPLPYLDEVTLGVATDLGDQLLRGEADVAYGPLSAGLADPGGALRSDLAAAGVVAVPFDKPTGEAEAPGLFVVALPHVLVPGVDPSTGRIRHPVGADLFGRLAYRMGHRPD